MESTSQLPLIECEDNHGSPKYFSRVTIPAALFLISLFGIMSNVSGIMMSRSMPSFPAWLLYGTAIMYTTGFWLLALVWDKPLRPSQLKWACQRYFLQLAVLTTAKGVLLQFSTYWVDSSMGQILANFALLQLPFFERIFIPSRKSDYMKKSQIAGLLIVLCGIAIGVESIFQRLLNGLSNGIVSSEQADKWYWIVMFILSTTFNAWEQTLQDVALHSDTDITEMSCLAWYNLYSIPMYILFIPLEGIRLLNGTEKWTPLTSVFGNQKMAFLCFFGIPSEGDIIAGICQSGSTIWPLIYCVGYTGLFCISTYMIKKYGVLFPNLIAANVSLCSIVVFMIPAIVSPQHASDFSVWPIVGSVIIIAGIIMKGEPSKKIKKHNIIDIQDL